MDISIVSASFIYSISFSHSIYSSCCLTHWNEAGWAHLKVLRHIDLLFRRIQLDDAFVSPFLLSLFLLPSLRPSCACVSSPHTHTRTSRTFFAKFSLISFWHFHIFLIFPHFPLPVFLLFTFYFTFAGLDGNFAILFGFSHFAGCARSHRKTMKIGFVTLLIFRMCDASPPAPLDTRVPLSLQRTACWLSLWLPPLWSSVTRGGGGGAWKGNGNGPESEAFGKRRWLFIARVIVAVFIWQQLKP